MLLRWRLFGEIHLFHNLMLIKINSSYGTDKEKKVSGSSTSNNLNLYHRLSPAGMVELVDTLVLGTSALVV